VIAAVEGRAHIHSDYALLASVIVAAEGATFQDVGHFAVGVTPGNGIFTTWSYRAGAGRARHSCSIHNRCRRVPHTNGESWQRWYRTARQWRVLGNWPILYLRAPEVTRRNTRIHFIQPLKERIVREVGYGLSLEGASSADLVKSKRSKS
jgi:hypothetical protein